MLVEEALHEDVHVQHAKKPATEARAKGDTRLLANGDARIVQRELVHRVCQPLEAILA